MPRARKSSSYPWLFTTVLTSVLSFCAGYSLHVALSGGASPGLRGVEVADSDGPLVDRPSISQKDDVDVWPARHLFIAIEGQWLSEDTKDLLAELRPGGVVFRESNTINAAQSLALVREIKQATGLGKQQYTDLPLVAVSHTRFAEQNSQNVFALGQGDTPEDARAWARRYAAESANHGINLVWGPALDLYDSASAFPALSSISFGTDRDRVTSMALAAADGFIDGGVLPVIKYFPGYGSARFAADGLSYTMAGDITDLAQSMYPFRDAVNRGIRGIVVGHMAVPVLDEGDPERPAALSDVLVTTVLRDRWGFDGVIVAEDLNTPSVRRRQSLEAATVDALAAGCDAVILMESDPAVIRRVCEAITRGVASGRLSAAALAKSKERLDGWQAWLRAPEHLQSGYDLDADSLVDILQAKQIQEEPRPREGEAPANVHVPLVLPEKTERVPFDIAKIEGTPLPPAGFEESVEVLAPESEESPEEHVEASPVETAVGDAPVEMPVDEEPLAKEPAGDEDAEEDSESGVSAKGAGASTGDSKGPIVVAEADVEKPEDSFAAEASALEDPAAEGPAEPIEPEPALEESAAEAVDADEAGKDTELEVVAKASAEENHRDLDAEEKNDGDDLAGDVEKEESSAVPAAESEQDGLEVPRATGASEDGEGGKGIVRLEHDVASGETLENVAALYGVLPSQIEEWNGLTDAELEPGMTLALYLPEKEATGKFEERRSKIEFEYKDVTHVVQAQETLSEIAEKYEITLQELTRWNGLTSHRIWSGMKLKLYLLPEGIEKDQVQQAFTLYRVAKGDTLFKIANKFGTSAKTLLVLNGLDDPNHVQLGQRLKVPL